MSNQIADTQALKHAGSDPAAMLPRFGPLLVIMAMIGLTGCDQPADSTDSANPVSRWYTAEQQRAGSDIFAQHCAGCHGQKAQGLVENWKKPLPQGGYPPPPLNGTAHAWHHPLPVLLTVIRGGGAPLGGSMPAFGQTLSEAQQLEVIAYFQSFWGDDIYRRWMEISGAGSP